MKKLQDTHETYGLHVKNEALLHTEKRNLMDKMQAHCEEESRLLEDIKEIQENIRQLENEDDKIIEQLLRVHESTISK